MANHNVLLTRLQSDEGGHREETIALDVPDDMTVGELVEKFLYSPPFLGNGPSPDIYSRLTIRAVTEERPVF